MFIYWEKYGKGWLFCNDCSFEFLKTAILVKELFVNRIFNNTANILTSNYNSTKYFQSELHFDYTVRDKFLVEEH